MSSEDHQAASAPALCRTFFLACLLYNLLFKAPARRTPGSADSEGLRPHAPTLEKASQPNFSFAPNLKLKIQAEFKTPNSRAKTQSSKLKTQTPNSNRIWILSSFPVFFQRSKYSKSGTQEPSIWLQSEHHIRSFLMRKHPILKGTL